MDILSSKKAASILSGPTTSTVASNISAMVKAQGEFRLKKDLEAVGDSYSGRLRDIGDQVTAALGVQPSIASAIDTLKATKGSLNSLSSLFDNMLETLNSAADPANVSAAALQFQGQMMTLRSMTTSGQGNMLSGSDQKVTYDINTKGAQVNVYGQNMGSSYTIVASDNKVWTPNESGSSLQAYDSYPDTQSSSSSGFYGGTVLNSLSGKAIDFTVMVNTATPTHLTGTLASKGLGVMDAWLYDDFNTQAGRDRAKADINAAMAAIKAEGIRYDASVSIAEYYSGKIDLEVSVLNNKQTEITEEQAIKAADLKQKFEQAQAALALSLQGVANMSLQTISLLPGTDTIFSSTTSTEPVFDIFA